MNNVKTFFIVEKLDDYLISLSYVYKILLMGLPKSCNNDCLFKKDVTEELHVDKF